MMMTVRYLNGRNVLCKQDVKATTEAEAISKLNENVKRMGNKINKIVSVR
jgi:hypothetical protein